jgi:acyl transferase domain-containing protein
LEQAVVTINKLKTRITALEQASRESIAIIGMGCRFPGGANDPESLWRLLRDGIDVITEVPRDRWDIDAFYDPDPDAPGKMYTRSGGFLERVDLFEPAFFGISPREAKGLDPQQRLLLEVSHEALDNAGYAPDALGESSTGVFVGLMSSDYASLLGGSIHTAPLRAASPTCLACKVRA